MLGRERAQHALGEVVHPGCQPEPERSAAAGRRPLGRLPDRVSGGDGLARERQHRLTRRRQCDAVARPLEQLDAELRLEALDLLAQRGLGHVQSAGGAAGVKLVGEDDKRPEQARIECHSRTF